MEIEFHLKCREFQQTGTNFSNKILIVGHQAEAFSLISGKYDGFKAYAHVYFIDFCSIVYRG